MGILDKFLRRKPTQEEFAMEIMEALAQGGARNLQNNTVERSIRVGSSDSTLYLDNAFADYATAKPAERAGVVQRYVSSFLHIKSTPKDFATACSSLMPVVRTPDYYSLSLLLLKADGKNTSKLDYPTKPVAPGLVAGIAYDTEHNIMNMNHATLEDWGASFDEALQIATFNLRDKTGTGGIIEIGAGLYISQWGDSYDSARILLPDILRRLPLNGDPLVFLPNRNQLWVTGRYNSTALKVMLTDGKASHFDEGHTLSPNLHVHTGGEWELYIPEDEELRRHWLSIRRQRDNFDYSQQKGYLDKFFQRQKLDLFVATCQVYKRQDESLFSRCVWSKGVDSLLPETDFIVLMEDLKSKNHFSVAWNDALPITQSLMERDPELFPARYRVRAFPSEAQLRQLRQFAQS